MRTTTNGINSIPSSRESCCYLVNASIDSGMKRSFYQMEARCHIDVHFSPFLLLVRERSIVSIQCWARTDLASGRRVHTLNNIRQRSNSRFRLRRMERSWRTTIAQEETIAMIAEQIVVSLEGKLFIVNDDSCRLSAHPLSGLWNVPRNKDGHAFQQVITHTNTLGDPCTHPDLYRLCRMKFGRSNE